MFYNSLKVQTIVFENRIQWFALRRIIYLDRIRIRETRTLFDLDHPTQLLNLFYNILATERPYFQLLTNSHPEKLEFIFSDDEI